MRAVWGADDGRPRVLHLAYEDPRQPGAGGGSVRTAEINARLSDRYNLLVVTARYPGCTSYSADGNRYSHAGLPGSRNVRIMSYFAAQPAVVARSRPDLVVEDFGAPFSTFGLPRFTSRPVIGVVQYLFAQQKTAEYHLPFDRIERFGVKRHDTLIAVSQELGDQLQADQPSTNVHVVPNGLPDVAFVERPSDPAGDIRYLGRLEDAQKGIGLLLEAYSRVAQRLHQDLLIAGEGPDRRRLERQAVELGVGDRVGFVGAVSPHERFDWLAQADVVVMPSRYETFGMVAAEAMAVGTPVVAFDIPCLRSLVTNETGRRVPAFDLNGFASAIVDLCEDPALRTKLGQTGRRSVRHLTWDRAAEDQAMVYDQAMAKVPRG